MCGSQITGKVVKRMCRSMYIHTYVCSTYRCVREHVHLTLGSPSLSHSPKHCCLLLNLLPLTENVSDGLPSLVVSLQFIFTIVMLLYLLLLLFVCHTMYNINNSSSNKNNNNNTSSMFPNCIHSLHVATQKCNAHMLFTCQFIFVLSFFVVYFCCCCCCYFVAACFVFLVV